MCSLSLEMFEKERSQVGQYLFPCSLVLGPEKTLPGRMVSVLPKAPASTHLPILTDLFWGLPS